MYKPPRRLLLAVTGASGMLYLAPLLAFLQAQSIEVHAIVSQAGEQVLGLELGVRPEHLPGIAQWFAHDDFSAAPASGSNLYDAMIILPCSMGSLAAIAAGYCGNLIHRAADVTLKERRPLLLAARETPLNRTHLCNMLKAHEAGAIICPPMPAFYSQPQNLEAVAEAFALRLCDLLGIQAAETHKSRWRQGAI